MKLTIWYNNNNNLIPRDEVDYMAHNWLCLVKKPQDKYYNYILFYVLD